MEVMEHLFQLSTIGLAYDGVGVAILGFAFFSKSLDAQIVESGTYYGGNDAVLRSLIQSQTDGVVGTILLLTGFMLQLLASVGVRCELFGQILAVFLLVAGIGYFLFLFLFFCEQAPDDLDQIKKHSNIQCFKSC